MTSRSTSRLDSRLYPDRAARRDRDHRRVDRPAVAGRSERARSRSPCSVHQQPQTDCPGRDELRVEQRQFFRADRTRASTRFNPPHWSTLPGELQLLRADAALLRAGADVCNATNFNLCSSDPANLTICGVQINSLICPSDTRNETIALPATQASTGVTPGWSFNEIYPLPPGTWTQAFTSYAGNAGTFTFGYTNLMSTSVLPNFNGLIYNDSSVRLASHHRRHEQHVHLRRAQQGAPVPARSGLCDLGQLVEFRPLVRHAVLPRSIRSTSAWATTSRSASGHE